MSGQYHDPGNAEDLSTQQLHPAHRLEQGLLLANRFRIISQLGAGSQASVYAAHDTLLEVDVALKLIPDASADPISMQAIRNEVVLARKLQHSNIVRVHDVFADDSYVFFTMAYVQGMPLYERLLQPLSRQEYSRWGLQLLKALEACHSAGVTHGDVKPDNILIDKDNNLQLIDFGIGRTVATQRDMQTSGHEKYSAPEIVHSGTPTDTSDTFSAGKVLQDMLDAVSFSQFSLSDTVWRRKQYKLIDALTQDSPTSRPDIPRAAELFQRAPSVRLYTVIAASIAAISIALIGMLFLVLQDNQPPRLPERTVQIAIVHDPAFPLLSTMQDMLKYPLLTEPKTALIDQDQASRYIDNLSLAPWENANDRSDFAATLGADIVLVLDASPTDNDAYLLRANALLMPANTPLVDVTQTVNSSTMANDVYHFGDTVIKALFSAMKVDRSEPDMRFLSTLSTVSSDNPSVPVKRIQLQYPEYPGGWLTGAQQALEQGNILKAREQLDVLFALEPESDYWHLQGQLVRAQLNDDLPLAQQAINRLVEHYPDRPQLLATRADIHQWANNSQAAIADYQAALALSPQNGQLWFELARLEIINGDIEHAIDGPLTKALVAFRKAGDEEGEALVLNAFGVAHLRLADYAVAQRYFTDALALRSAKDYPFDRATTLANRANVAAINGDYTLAEEALNEASALLESLGNKARQAHVLDTLGFLFEEQGRYRQALEYYKRGLDIRIQEDDTTKQAESMSNVAYMHFLTGDFSLAEIYWQQAVNQFSTLNDQAHLLRSYQNLAQLSLVKGDNNAARRHLNQVADSLSPEQSQEKMYNDMLLSYLSFSEGRREEAQQRIARARTVAEETGDTRAWVEMVLWQAEICLLIADWSCLKSHINELEAQVTTQMIEASAVLAWLRTAYAAEQAPLPDPAQHELLSSLDNMSIPVVTELKIRLDLLHRLYDIPPLELIKQLANKVAPRFYQAYLQYHYLLALNGESLDVLSQQLAAHPDYWRNHLYYQPLEGESAQKLKQELLDAWLSQLTESQALQYQQTYID